MAVGNMASPPRSREQDIIPPRPAARLQQEEELESSLELGRLMLGEGLVLKKITLEGFTVPVVLRLLDRRRRPLQQQQQQQQQRQTIISEGAATAGEAALSITWVHQDTFGFDMRGITVRRVEDCVDGSGVGREAAAGRKRGRGVGSADCCYGQGKGAQLLVLSWSMGGGSAEVVLEAASPQQRDLLAVTVETLVSGLLDRGDDDAASRLSGAGGDGTAGEGGDGGSSGSELPRAASCGDSSAVLGPPPGVANIYDSDDDDDDDEEAAAAMMLAEFDKAAAVAAAAAAAAETGSRRTTLAPHETDVTAAAHRDRGGGLLFSSANGIDAAATHPRERRLPRGGLLHRRGMSFSPGGGPPAGVPVLARATTTGTVMGRESEAALQQEEEQHLREQRQDAMMRLLAVYDRARDESQAAAWRLGVRTDQ